MADLNTMPAHKASRASKSRSKAPPKASSRSAIPAVPAHEMPAVDDSVRQQFEAALASFVERVRRDDYVVAAILFGSLSYDSVWAKSDIDLMLITRDETQAYRNRAAERFLSLVEDGVNIHAMLQPRATFRKTIEGSLRSSFMHSALARGRLLFTRDETLRELFEENAHRLGARDREVQLLRSATYVLPALYKAEKWLHVKKDVNYSFLWLTHCVTGLAQVEVYLAGQIAGREVIQQAVALNPEFFDAIYTNLVSKRKTAKDVAAALQRVEEYLTRKRRTLFGPVLEYLSDAGAARSATEIENHFRSNFGIENVPIACEWLADQDVIAKVSTPVRVTEKSRVELNELAFYYDSEGFGHG